MKLNAIQYARETVESGSHTDWNLVVDELKTGKSLGLNLSVRKAFLVVAFQGRVRLIDGDKAFVEAAPDTGWNLLAVPLTGENALRTISAYIQGPDYYNLTALPIGMACVGQTHDGGWDDDFIGVNVEWIAEMCAPFRYTNAVSRKAPHSLKSAAVQSWCWK